MYEYHVDIKQHTWASWEDKLRSGWRYNPRLVFFYLTVRIFSINNSSHMHSVVESGGRKAHENLSTAGGLCYSGQLCKLH